jgi:FixJ family two-component response regulator
MLVKEPDVLKRSEVDMSAICVIEDDALTRDAIKFLLQIEGFAVKTFSSALEFFGTDYLGDIGCILTDVEMPGGVTGLNQNWSRLSEQFPAKDKWFSAGFFRQLAP